MVRLRAGALALSLAAAGGARAQEGPGVTIGALLDLRLTSSSTSTGFFDRGLGKVRYGGENGDRRYGFHIAQASLVVKAAVSETLFAHVQVNVDPESYDAPGLSGVDVVEAYAAFRPALSRKLGLRMKAGIFFPPISLENDGFAWSPTRTLTPSAANSWIGEEVRVTGLETSLAVLLPKSDLLLTGAVFGWNDPVGTLLAWRGWALHDRQTGYTDRIPLPATGEFGPGGDFPEQSPWTAPFREVDGRAGWYTAASWSVPQGVEVRALYLDDAADRRRIERGQWAWETQFASAGVRVPAGTVEILAQAIDGRTRITSRLLVDVRFRTAYALASLRAGRHRFTLRGDLFRNTDQIAGEYDEHGWALTAAWLASLTDHVRAGLEVLRVDSTRPGRYDVHVAPRAIETLVQASVRLRF